MKRKTLTNGKIEDVEYRYEKRRLILTLPKGMTSFDFGEFRKRNGDLLQELKEICRNKKHKNK